MRHILRRSPKFLVRKFSMDDEIILPSTINKNHQSINNCIFTPATKDINIRQKIFTVY